MTDRIDLDEMGGESDERPDANHGDWFWRDEGDPDAEPDPGEGWLDAAGTGGVDGASAGERSGKTEDDTATRETGDGTGAGDAVEDDPSDGMARDRDPVPGVPRSNRDRPVGVPVEGGGAGGGRGTAGANDAGAGDTADGAEPGSDAAADPATGEAGMASGPHGGGADDMTLALTYEAAQRLADPRLAVIEAKSWTDWIGIVGDVPAYEINRFQREHEIDVDFFSGAGQEPAERLADVDEHSMFYAERMALVGLTGEAGIAERAGWEFVPLATAAEKADWEVTDAENDRSVAESAEESPAEPGE